MTLADLRRDAPQWQWSAERRCGLGWEYRGERGEEVVWMRAYGVVGYSDDDVVTQWRAECGGHSELASMFLMRNAGLEQKAGCDE